MNLEEKINPVLRQIPPSGIRKFFDLVANTKGVISLGVGEPDFVTPWYIREEGIYSLEKGYTMYTSNQGLLELREEISRYLLRLTGVAYDPVQEVLVTVGVSEGVDLALRALVSPGDEVLIPEPSYVSYGPTTMLAGGKPVYIRTRPENGFKLTPELLEEAITPKSKILLLCYPNNPTGAVMTADDLAKLLPVIAEHDLLVISDEIYAELTYEGKHTSIASFPGMKERTVILNGFSKAFAMTGWRLGYAAGPKEIIAAMTKIHQYTMLCAPITAQKAAIEALKNQNGAVKKMVEEYNYRRRILVEAFSEMGLWLFEPKGAFYAFPDISATGLSSEEFAERLLFEEKVAVVPGSAFGPSGEGFIRISYATARKDLIEALKRIKRFVRKKSLKKQ
ncbi:aminotransferase class I/II-fold pyridoxal phosphate-dependent enzyme [Carboxydothermus ferrireducens]|uniref:Aminotransferase n=1 Tax=Carboxydothermus ferrireducens DSM 11255 TaxID=1119529 RepID=A0ABX2R8G1_9THEO|nr:aminotransferase class I/II-fold pyridoxal phosphate-dependent enzyme [Carboxydothermus ferrireducens]NYE57467.1 aminotransferase [Carboxydothermus ferrireducens DSM 11255]